MAEKEPTEQPIQAKKILQKRRKTILVGAVAASALMLLGAWGLRSLLVPKAMQPVQQPKVMALVDVRKACDAHPRHEELQSLQEQEIQLKEALKKSLQPMQAEPPKVEEKPFDDAVWQKNAQNIIGTAAEIMREKKKAAADYKAATEADYTARKDELNAEYLNAILNIQLKLQNSDNLHLTQEEVDQLIAKREELQTERNARQLALLEEWEQEITNHAEEAVRERQEKLREEMETSKAALEMDAAKRHAEAQERDAARMAEAMQSSMERQQTRKRLLEELRAVTQERISLERQIMSDISGQVAKIAILRHYTMVLASPAPPLPDRFPGQAWNEEAPEEYAEVIAGTDAADITEELLKEVRKL